MISFSIALVLLIAGYFTYGKLAARIFGENRQLPTPVQTMADGVDYMSGMLSVRYGGASLPEIVGEQLGSRIRQVMRVFALLLMSYIMFAPEGFGALITGCFGMYYGYLFSLIFGGVVAAVLLAMFCRWKRNLDFVSPKLS